jgi:HemY protein
MIRFIIFLLATAGLAFAAVWLADRPGAVSIDWLDYHADTSVGVLIEAVLAIVVAVLVAWSLGWYLLRAPGRVRRGSRQRRAARGQQAIAKGLVAIGAGDVHAALRHAREAQRHAARRPSFSACAGSSSKRSAATMRRRRAALPKRPPRRRRRSPGPARRRSISIVPTATGPARSKRSNATTAAGFSTRTPIGASAQCCSPPRRCRSKRPTA